MAFDIIIFSSALFALTTETIEDAFVLLIYQIAFGKRNVIYGLIAASITVSSVLIVLVLYGIPNIESYSEYVIIGSGLFLVALGGYWMIRFLLVKLCIIKEESDSEHKSMTKSFAPFMMVFVELLEILAILVPFILTNHVVEASFSIIVSISISIILIFVIDKRLRNKFENKLTQAKMLAGIALILSGTVIILNL